MEDGELFIYAYYNLENRPLDFRWLKRAVDLLRHFTTHAPASFSYPGAFALAIGILLSFGMVIF